MDVLKIIIILALLATIVSLFMGVVSMGRGGEYDEKHSNQMMRARVVFQGVALLLMLVALYFVE